MRIGTKKVTAVNWFSYHLARLMNWKERHRVVYKSPDGGPDNDRFMSIEDCSTYLAMMSPEEKARFRHEAVDYVNGLDKRSAAYCRKRWLEITGEPLVTLGPSPKVES